MTAPNEAVGQVGEAGGVLDVLASREAFCAVVGSATRWDVRGAWAGSAYRHHPNGLIVDGIKFTDEHHVDLLCSIQITDGEGWSKDYWKDPTTTGNPDPRPVGGTAICVWRNGRWLKDEYRVALETKVRAILQCAADQIATGRRLYAAREERERQERAENFGVAESAALRAVGAAK